MLKSALRKQALAERKSLSDVAYEELNNKLLTQFKTLDLTKVRAIHLFLPIAKYKEPNTFLIIDWLQLQHPEITIIVPKADFLTCEMTQHVYNGKHDLVESKHQILEPKGGQLFVGMPDIVLIPLLVVDQKGYRVGYGKGFYDRFLQNLPTQRIGLSFFAPIVAINDVHLNDIRLDMCITPEEIINFEKAF